VTSDSSPGGPTDPQAIDARASALMKQGMQLLAEATPDKLDAAITYFDQARALRSGLPLDESPLFKYGLAACWLNRGEALIRMRAPERLPDAIRACDEGLLLLEELPLGDDPRFPRRLAMAHQNRGLAMQLQGSTAEAAASFTRALGVLDLSHSEQVSDKDYLQAAIWTNLAGAHVDQGERSWPAARHAAERAIALVAEREEHDVESAAVGLQARHVMCRALATRLQLAAGVTADDLHAATDAADDGLRLARLWEQRGVTLFRGIAHDLFRFGARVYAAYQPQFLDEFVADNLDPAQSSQQYVESPEMRAAAEEALTLLAPADPDASSTDD
jgi:tetratricopeptide (TPR) repeat protein